MHGSVGFVLRSVTARGVCADWNSNDADVCCSGGSVGAFLIWGASTQGGRSKLPSGSPSCTNAVGYRNSTLRELLEAFF